MSSYDDIVGALDRVAGPLTPAGEHAFRGTLDGHPIDLEVVSLSHGDGRRRWRGARSVVDLGGRPIDVRSGWRRNTSLAGTEVRTGDATFDAEFIVAGEPAEVIAAALDDDMRSWLLAECAGGAPGIRVDRGRVERFVQVRFRHPDRVLDDATLAERLRWGRRIGWSLVRAFDDRLEELRRAHGDAAARSWLASHEELHRARQARRRRRRGCFLALPVVLVAATIAWLAYSVWR